MCLCLVIQSCPTLSDRLIVAHQISLPWDFSAKNTGVGCHFPPLQELPDPGIDPRSPTL